MHPDDEDPSRTYPLVVANTLTRTLTPTPTLALALALALALTRRAVALHLPRHHGRVSSTRSHRASGALAPGRRPVLPSPARSVACSRLHARRTLLEDEVGEDEVGCYEERGGARS